MDSRGRKARIYYQGLLGVVTTPKLCVRAVMLGKHGTHTLSDAIIHTLDLDYHQPIPNVRQLL